MTIGRRYAGGSVHFLSTFASFSRSMPFQRSLRSFSSPELTLTVIMRVFPMTMACAFLSFSTAEVHSLLAFYDKDPRFLEEASSGPSTRSSSSHPGRVSRRRWTDTLKGQPSSSSRESIGFNP